MSAIDRTSDSSAANWSEQIPISRDSGAIGARYLRMGRGPAGIEVSRSSHRIAFAGVFLFTMLLYIRPNEMFPEVFGTFPLPKIVAGVAVLSYIAGKLGRGERLSIAPFELKMLGLITLLGVAFIPFAAAPMDSVDLLLDMFIKVMIIFVLMINVITTRQRLRSMMSLVVVCGTIFAALAIKSYLIGDFTIVEKKDVGVVGLRISGAVGGIFGNPNDLATSLNLLMPLAVGLALTSSGLKRIFFFSCSAILVAGVIVTFSRGGFLGLATMAAVLLWKAGRNNRAITTLAFVVMFAVFVLAMPSGYAGRITSMFNMGEDPTGSSQARRELIDRAVNVAVHHPIIGIGMGNFHIYSIHEQVAHNSYLEIAAELGMAGLMAYLLLILAPLRSLRKIERQTTGRDSALSAETAGMNRTREIHYLSIAMQGMLFAYIVCSFFGSIQYQWFLYYPVAYAIVLRRIYATELPDLAGASVASVSTIAANKAARRAGVIWGDRSRGSSRAAAIQARTSIIDNLMK